MRLCRVKGRKAMFHGWEQVSEVVEPSPLRTGHQGGTIRHTNAIVEYEDGSIDSVVLRDMVFQDTAKVMSRVERDIARWEAKQNQADGT